MGDEVETELKLEPPRALVEELQAKLQVAELSSQERDELFTRVQAALGLGDFSVHQESRKLIEDEYFDDRALTLFHAHVSLRARRSGGRVEVTLKTPRGFLPVGLERNERTLNVSEAEYEALRSDQFRALVAAHFPELPGRGVQPILINENSRLAYGVTRGDERYELCIDQFRHTTPDRAHTSGPHWEIELEAKNGAAVAQLGTIAAHLRTALGLKEVVRSKYEEGVARLKLSPLAQESLAPLRHRLQREYTGIFGAKVFWLAALTLLPLLAPLKIHWLELDVSLATVVYAVYHGMGIYLWASIYQGLKLPEAHSDADWRSWDRLRRIHHPLGWVIYLLIALTLLSKVTLSFHGSHRLALPGFVYDFLGVQNPAEARAHEGETPAHDAVNVDVDFSPGNLGAAPSFQVAAAPYLKTAGISIQELTPADSQLVFVNNRGLYGGRAVRPSISQNLLRQDNTGNVPASFTLRFDAPLESVSFVRPELYADTSSGITHPAWSARALDAAGRELGSCSEGLIRRFEVVPASTCTIRAPGFEGIAGLRIDSDPRLVINGELKPFAAFGTVIIERLTLVPLGR